LIFAKMTPIVAPPQGTAAFSGHQSSPLPSLQGQAAMRGRRVLAEPKQIADLCAARERARETDPRSEARNGSRGRRQVLRHVRRGKVGARDRAKVETAPDRVRVLRREYRAGDADQAQLEAEGMTPAKERRWRRETDREFAVWERQMAAAWSGRRIPPIDELDERERAVTGPSPATGATIGDETGRSE